MTLAATRASLRRALLGPERADGGNGRFPRSRTMRFVTDPRNRWLRVAATAAGAMLMRRVVPVGRAGLLFAALRTAQRLLRSRLR